MYVRDIQKGVTAVDCEPAIERETVATALVDGELVLCSTRLNVPVLY